MELIHTGRLTEGNIVAQNIYDGNHNLLVGHGNILTETTIKRLMSRGIDDVYIDTAVSSGIETHAPITEVLRSKIVHSLNKLDIDKVEENAIQLVKELNDNLLDTDMKLISTYDNMTAQHSLNVAIYAVIIGRAIGYNKTQLEKLAESGLLHDIGKLMIPKSIINKNGKLNPEERQLILRHSEYGYNCLKDRDNIYSVVRVGVLEHHENEDGTGYPRNLHSDKIHDFAKILHVADVYDALTSNRSYKKSWSSDEALEYIKENTGNQFDKYIVNKFIQNVPKYRKGSRVILSDGRIAIVVRNRIDDLSNPVVRDTVTMEDIKLWEEPDVGLKIECMA